MKVSKPCPDKDCRGINVRLADGADLQDPKWECQTCGQPRNDVQKEIQEAEMKAKKKSDNAAKRKRNADAVAARVKAEEKLKKGAAGGETPVHKPVERNPHVRPLPCKLDDPEEIEKASKEFASLYRRREATLEEKRQKIAEYKETLAGIDDRMDELATTVEDHLVTLPVKCIELFYVETQTVQVVRLDSKEIVETRAAEAKDAQETLPLDKDGKPAAPGAKAETEDDDEDDEDGDD